MLAAMQYGCFNEGRVENSFQIEYRGRERGRVELTKVRWSFCPDNFRSSTVGAMEGSRVGRRVGRSFYNTTYVALLSELMNAPKPDNPMSSGRA